AETIPEWFSLASKDEKVAKALRLWGTGVFDWVNLYRVYEIIETDVGERIQLDGWASKTLMSRFPPQPTILPSRVMTLDTAGSRTTPTRVRCMSSRRQRWKSPVCAAASRLVSRTSYTSIPLPQSSARCSPSMTSPTAR